MRNILFGLIFLLSLAAVPVRAVGVAQGGALPSDMRSTSALREQPRYTVSPSIYSPSVSDGWGWGGRYPASGRRLRTAATSSLHSYSGTGAMPTSGFTTGRGASVRPSLTGNGPTAVCPVTAVRPVLPGASPALPGEAGPADAPVTLFSGRHRTGRYTFRHSIAAGGVTSRRYTPPTAANAWLDKYRNFFGEDPADEAALEAFKQWYMGSGLYGGDDDDDDPSGGSALSSIYQQWVLRFYNYYGRYPYDDDELDEFIRWWQGGGIYTPGEVPLGDGLWPLLLLALLAAAYIRKRNTPASAGSLSIVEQKNS